MKVIKTLSILIVIVSSERVLKTCTGANVENIEDDCELIEQTPLIIQNIEDLQIYAQKLSNIKIIKSGLEVIHNDFENLKYFDNLEVIENNLGEYAIKFSGNTNLKRLTFPKLTKVNGRVYFYNDEFIKFAYSDKDSINDLLVIEAAARQSENSCQTKFLQVELAKTPAGIDFIWWILFALCLIAFCVDVFLVVRIIVQLRNFDTHKDLKVQKTPELP